MKKASVILLFCLFVFPFTIYATTFTVNSNSDTTDANQGNGICVDSSGNCTLRAAVQEANAVPSNDVITFTPGLQTITLSLGTEILVNNNGTLQIKGLGANLLTIDGGVGNNRIFTSSGATLSISGLSITGGNGGGSYNSEPGHTFGGAIFFSLGNLTLDSVSFFENANPSGLSSGGALFIRDNIKTIIKNSAFYNNTSGSCAAISNIGPFEIFNSTVSGNKAIGNGLGGGICFLGFNSNNISVYVPTLRNVTITNNFAAWQGGGIFFGSLVANATMSLSNSIVAGNSAALYPEMHVFVQNEGTVISNGNNLIGDSAGDARNTNLPVIYQQTDILDTPPKLGALQNNGGMTPTHALLNGSPAIDAGNNSGAFSTDQRGLPRIIGGTIDIGAYEDQQQSMNCTYSLSTSTANFATSGGGGSFNVTTTSECSWSAASYYSWITVTNASGTGNGTVSFSVQPNIGSSRIGAIVIGGQSYIINQANGCLATPSATSANIAASGGIIVFNINAETGCAWSAVSSSPWIAVTTGAAGDGNGTVAVSITANNGTSRRGLITVGNQSLEIIQAAPIDLILASGRVITPNFRPIRGALVTFIDLTTGETRTTITSQLGYFHFRNIERGRQYSVTISHKRYKFTANNTVTYNTNGLIQIFTSDFE